jgi:hypothetical protein
MNKPDIKKQVEDALQRAKDAGYVSMYPTDEELWHKVDMILGDIPEVDMYSEQNYQYAQDVLISLAN